MFGRILIANRGEIACRIIRTCRRMGVETVAVYSEADAGACHAEMADRAVCIGPAAASESYLRGEAIVGVALAHECQAIHPGYGFLSENAGFAEAVAANGLTFIGPKPEAIRAMGEKAEAKRIMEAAGVPVVPGYHGADQSPERLAGEAERIGYPVLIKAVAGGGGKGMRRVDAAADFAEALAAARREAQAAFGNDRVLVEKMVCHPRHVEVQVFGDGSRAVHLFERDCSLQRRHQKVIEEAPAPGIDAAFREAITGAAVRAAEAIGYAGAGTVEFIADGSEGLRADGFWFMEMNTRLQVEHPVTEAVTGVDLVEWQLRVAAGEALPVAQEDISLTGHAVEARVYAEDAGAGFLPATGRIECLTFARGLRADSGVRAGDAITAHYDPMIAKLIVHRPTRAAALAALAEALERSVVAGTVTNMGFLAALTRHGEVVAGRVDTGLIERDLKRLTERPPVPGEAVALAAAALMGELPPQAGFTLWAPLWQDMGLICGTETFRVRVSAGAEIRVQIDGAVHNVSRDLARVNGRRAEVLRHGAGVSVVLDRAWTFQAADPLAREAADAQAGDELRAPMPGLVKSLTVAPGERVAAGQALGLMEAMKMELPLRAPRDAVVAEVLAGEGAQVAQGALLIRFEAAP